MTALEDQETTIAVGRADDVVHVWTSDVRHLRRLESLASSTDYVVKRAGGVADGYGDFTVKAENYRPFLAIRGKRERSEAQRAAALAAGDRLRARHALAAQGEV